MCVSVGECYQVNSYIHQVSNYNMCIILIGDNISVSDDNNPSGFAFTCTARVCASCQSLAEKSNTTGYMLDIFK